ncbi:hypothetical protein [Lactobacillus sp. CBA3605] [Lactiplantibacillus mudanjiangensis]|uniref:MarR family winged helix-turn-helix transcriptional regulator n=1 Tax=Lactiplantibacillus mudanjiangensis TaxID=1296538 RepID=UPI0010147F10|nr:hypothetical protein [Lactobacillus sp. CBA3605] [Lactiplantibacillus mudanjiangensis]
MEMRYERFFSMINRVIRQRLNQQLKPYGLSESNFMLVLRICETPGISQDQLNREIYREHSIVTKAVSRLATKGWVEIKPDQNDGRRTNLFPSKLARSNYDEIKQILDDTNHWIATTLSADEQQALDQILAKLVPALMNDDFK